MEYKFIMNGGWYCSVSTGIPRKAISHSLHCMTKCPIHKVLMLKIKRSLADGVDKKIIKTMSFEYQNRTFVYCGKIIRD